METIEGLFAPLATPFTDDSSSISEIRFSKEIRWLLAKTIDGFVVASDCGEFATLSQSERKQLVEWLARDCAGKPFLVHVSSLSTSSSLDLAQHASRHGARAAILMPPYYGTYTADELIAFYRTVSTHAGLPIILVDPQNLLSEEARENIAEFPEIVIAASLTDRHRANVSCYKGHTSSDEFVVSDALVSPLALLQPSQLSAAINGEETELAKLIILEETLGRARVSKAGLEALGVDVGPPRPPLRPLTGAVGAALRTLLGG